jgi:hypothetical protein
VGTIRDFKDSLLEVLWIAKCCLTTFWFWLPILFMGYVFLQLWMMFFIHPLTAFVLPAILCVYAFLQEEKRFKARYGFGEMKRLTSSHGFGESAEEISGFRWEVERTVQEYEHLLRKDKKKKKGKAE